jgi:arylsulfatase A
MIELSYCSAVGNLLKQWNMLTPTDPRQRIPTYTIHFESHPIEKTLGLPCFGRGCYTISMFQTLTNARGWQWFTASVLILAGGMYSAQSSTLTRPAKPNFIVIFCDDLGYGDIGPFGSTLNQTPHLDRMAEEGLRLTSFYVTCSVCTPSRSSLMTGCYAQRVDMHVNDRNLCVLFPGDKKGLNPSEITIAEVLKTQGYATACIGKWHMGDQPEFLPTQQGFDTYFGIPYSNDMGERKDGSRPPLPLIRNQRIIEAPADQSKLTERYTQEAVRFIQQHQNDPFFIYLPHTFPHVPLFAGEKFKGKSKNGLYGDVIEELDASTGTILNTLRQLNLDKRTMVIFTSDNGATGGKGRSNGPLRGTKGTTWEGGMREPFVAWWPGQIPAGTTSDALTSTIDLLPTLAYLANAEVPSDRILDGLNIWSIINQPTQSTSPHDYFYYYQMQQLQALRDKQWKLHLPLVPKMRNWGKPETESPIMLFDLATDIGETNNVAEEYPEVVERMLHQAQRIRHDLGDLNIQAHGRRRSGWNDSPTLLRAGIR